MHLKFHTGTFTVVETTTTLPDHDPGDENDHHEQWMWKSMMLVHGRCIISMNPYSAWTYGVPMPENHDGGDEDDWERRRLKNIFFIDVMEDAP